MNKTYMWVVVGVLAVLLVGGGIFLLNQNRASQEVETLDEQTEATDMPANPQQATMEAVGTTSTTSAESTGVVKEFTVTGSSFKFEPAALTVNKGDRVRLTFKNSGGIHDFVIDEFNVRTDRISENQADVVEFTADQTGTFEFYCSVGNHRQMGMKGTLTVR
jgi:plastocyanin